MSAGETRHAIIAEVAARHDLTVADLKGPATERRISDPRQEAMALMAAAGRWNRGEIAHALNRTTWTVTHGVDAHWRRAAKAACPQPCMKLVSRPPNGESSQSGALQINAQYSA